MILMVKKNEKCRELCNPITSFDGRKTYCICQLPKDHSGSHNPTVNVPFLERLFDLIFSIE